MPANAYLLDEMNRRLAVVETRTEERHIENLAAQGQIADTVHAMGERFSQHIQADEKTINQLSRLLNENTTVTNKVHAVVLKIEAAKTLGGWIKNGLHGLAAILLSVAIIIAVVLWLMGKGPFPPIHP